MADLLCSLRRGCGGAPCGVKLPPVDPSTTSVTATPHKKAPSKYFTPPAPPRSFAGRPQPTQRLPHVQRRAPLEEDLPPTPVSFGSSVYYNPPPEPVTHKIAQTGAAVLPGGRPDPLPVLGASGGLNVLDRTLPVYPYGVVPGKSQAKTTVRHPSARWHDRESFAQRPGLAVDEDESWLRGELDEFDQRLGALPPLGAGRYSAFPAVGPTPRLADVMFVVMLLRESKMVQTLHRKGAEEIAQKWTGLGLMHDQKVPKAMLHRVLRAVCKSSFREDTSDQLYSLFAAGPAALHSGMNLEDLILAVDIIMATSNPKDALQFFFSLTGGLTRSAANVCEYITRYEIDVLRTAYASSTEGEEAPAVESASPTAPVRYNAQASDDWDKRTPETTRAASTAASGHESDPLESQRAPAPTEKQPQEKRSFSASADKKPALAPPSRTVGLCQHRLAAIADTLQYDSLGRVPLKDFAEAFLGSLGHDAFPRRRTRSSARRSASHPEGPSP